MKLYFAGELFSFKHLIGNSVLAAAIHKQSKNRYECILPQSLEQRETTPHKIRDQDIKTLLSCDVALFNFDGTEVDSGTVVEFMIAKFLDIPAVIIRSDFRKSGDSSDPWNLMMSFYPRTEVILVDSIKEYQECLKAMLFVSDEKKDSNDIAAYSIIANISAMQNIANKIVSAFDRLVDTESLLPEYMYQNIYYWVAKAAGFEKRLTSDDLKEIIDRRLELRLVKNAS